MNKLIKFYNTKVRRRFIMSENKKENQVDNLMNLVERHTRTERH